jgi:hypothetical protein
MRMEPENFYRHCASRAWDASTQFANNWTWSFEYRFLRLRHVLGHGRGEQLAMGVPSFSSLQPPKSPSAPPVHEPENKQKQQGADRRGDNRGDNAGAEVNAQLW